MADGDRRTPDGSGAEWENLRRYVLAMNEHEPGAAREIAAAMGDEAPELPDDDAGAVER